MDRRLYAKRHLTQLYKEYLAELDGVELVSEPRDCSTNYWLVCLRFTTEDPLAAPPERLQLLELAHGRPFASPNLDPIALSSDV
ncbi:aminotransferase domain protein [Synechococcus sp. NOUM97013]|nr:aminotransferase domain protein [Synechococcus sp. NOUM97013]